VVQFVLEHGQTQDQALVVAKLRGQMLQMARHKFASNVCEKALVTADSETRRALIDEIMTPKQDGSTSPIVAMMKDQFASMFQPLSRVVYDSVLILVTDYVLQRALAVAEGQQKEDLINNVRPHLVTMRRYSSAYSKHLTSSTFPIWSCHRQLLIPCSRTSPREMCLGEGTRNLQPDLFRLMAPTPRPTLLSLFISGLFACSYLAIIVGSRTAQNSIRCLPSFKPSFSVHSLCFALACLHIIPLDHLVTLQLSSDLVAVHLRIDSVFA
jgi:hypothetical protein